MKMPRFSNRKGPAPAQWALPPDPRPERGRSYLALIAIASVIAWQVPLGRYALYPFTLLATWFHEMGHGLAALLLGADFERLVIFANGSGYAVSAWPADTPGIFHAVTAAAGLVGPSLVGAALIVASRSQRSTRAALYALAMTLAVSTAIWVRSPVGLIVLPAFAIAILAIAAKGSANIRRLAIEFLGVQAAVSILSDVHYLFSDSAIVDGRRILSDTGAIAQVLLLPYWVWGTTITAFIAWLLWKALGLAAGPPQR